MKSFFAALLGLVVLWPATAQCPNNSCAVNAPVATRTRIYSQPAITYLRMAQPGIVTATTVPPGTASTQSPLMPRAAVANANWQQSHPSHQVRQAGCPCVQATGHPCGCNPCRCGSTAAVGNHTVSGAYAAGYAGVNGVRAEARLGGLAVDPGLQAFAEIHAGRMASTGRMYHSDVRERANYGALGENVAAMPAAGMDIGAWRNSDGHYRNMVGSYTRMGYADIVGANGQHYSVTLFR